MRFFRQLAALGNHDFCPWINRYVYWLKQPIGWFLVGALASLLIGLFLAPQGFVMLAAIMAVVAMGVAWPWIGMRGITCRLQFERSRARENDNVRVKLAIANRWPWPVWGLAVERGFFAEENPSGDTPAVALARVAGWSESDFYWEFRPPLRGVYPTEPPRLATGFPFGIWHARREIVVENELLVWPRTTRLTSIPPVSGRDLTVAGMLSNHVGDEGDFLGVRPYRQGDLLRHVHWAQTARRDSFVICERQSTARRTVRVTMDVDPNVHRGDRIDGSLEWTVRVGASICQEFLAHSSHVECVIGDRRIVVEPGPNGLKRLLDALARFSPEEDSDSVGASLSLPEGALSIVVTTDRGAGRFRNGNGGTEQSRFVLLNAAAFESQMLGKDDGSAEWHLDGTSGRKVWMTINNADDVSGQLRRAWERFCHDDWCAA